MNFFANTGAVALSIRPAREEDLDRIVEIHTSCYPDDRGASQRRLGFVQNAFGGLADLRVAEQKGRVVGQGFGFSLSAWFGGAAVALVGIASIGVAPEARRAGVGRALVSHLEEEGKARGAVLVMLHPFRHGFYRALGYADVTPNRRLVLDPHAIPEAWVGAARSAALHAADGDDVSLVVDLYTRVGRTGHGWIDRPKTLWSRLFSSERLSFVVGEDLGYVAFEIDHAEAHAKTVMRVHELVAVSDDARRILWGFLGMQSGQVAEVEIEIPDDDPVLFALTDADGNRHGTTLVEHDLGRIVAGPMVKMLDVGAALGARGYARDAEAALTVDGELVNVVAQGGHASVSRATRPTRTDTLRTDARAAASIAFGGLGVRGAVSLGLAEGDAAAIASAEALWKGPAFFTIDRF